MFDILIWMFKCIFGHIDGFQVKLWWKCGTNTKRNRLADSFVVNQPASQSCQTKLPWIMLKVCKAVEFERDWISADASGEKKTRGLYQQYACLQRPPFPTRFHAANVGLLCRASGSQGCPHHTSLSSHCSICRLPFHMQFDHHSQQNGCGATLHG